MPKIKLNEHFRWLIVEKVLEGISCRIIAEQLNLSIKYSTHPYFLKFKNTLETEDLLRFSCSAIVLHDTPSKTFSTISQRKCSFSFILGIT